MKFAVAGAGAIGAYIGAMMARAGLDVTLFARGPHCRAMQERGVRIVNAGGAFEARPRVVDTIETIGTVDVVFLCVKAHSLPELAPRLPALFGPETTVVSMQNGIPWWYFSGSDRLETVDPGGVIAASIELRRVIGSIVYLSTETVEPGVIRHIESNRVSIGEPGGVRSERCRSISEALVAAGLRAPITTHIRQEIWVKLMGNIAFNPISALTGATLVAMARDPAVSNLARSIMAETEAVARKVGIEIPVTIDQRIAGAEKVGEHKTSMLQDLEAGRPLELEAIVGAALELGDRLGIAMPHTRTVYACAKLLEKHRRSAG
ncbi:MAG: panE, 2-dehydropantoate 2-reductase [Bryobacterales bacterium]|nr:panE, 2-dehydropantoate 2-reductase [Bryobacterales bacterium]